MTKVVVCGGRDFRDVAFVVSRLNRVHKERNIVELMEGGARGVDEIARGWAKARKITQHTCKADWGAHGKAAGPIRNGKMLEWKPDLVIAFPGGKGTANMVKQAKARQVEVIEFLEDEVMEYRERVRVQTLRWVEGSPYHNKIDDECCPDFSCCVPELFETDEGKRWACYHRKWGRLA